MDGNDAVRAAEQKSLDVLAKLQHDVQWARVVVLKGKADDVAALGVSKGVGGVLSFAAQVVDEKLVGVVFIEETHDLTARVAINAFHARRGETHGDDALGDVGEV